MTFWAGFLRRAQLLSVCLVLAGCFPAGSGPLDEEKEPHFLAGKSRISTLDYKGAIECFEKALQTNPQSASAHFELAWILDVKEPDPAAAIYHYQHYLKLRPEAGNADVVKQRITACKQALAENVSLGPVTEKMQRQLEQMVETNKALLEENRQLHEALEKWSAYAARLQTLTNAAATEAAVLAAYRSGHHEHPRGTGPSVSGGRECCLSPHCRGVNADSYRQSWRDSWFDCQAIRREAGRSDGCQPQPRTAPAQSGTGPAGAGIVNPGADAGTARRAVRAAFSGAWEFGHFHCLTFDSAIPKGFKSSSQPQYLGSIRRPQSSQKNPGNHSREHVRVARNEPPWETAHHSSPNSERVASIPHMKKRAALFGRKDRMDQNLGKGLWHDAWCSTRGQLGAWIQLFQSWEGTIS